MIILTLNPYLPGLLTAILTASLWGTRDVVLRKTTLKGAIVETMLINAAVSLLSSLIPAFLLGELLLLASMDFFTIFVFTLAGIIQFFVAVWLYYEGIRRVGASKTSAASLIQSFLTPYLGILLLGEPSATHVIIGVLIGALGITITSYKGEGKFNWGILFGIGAGLGWTTTPLILRFFFERARVPFLATSLGSSGSIIMILALLAFMRRKDYELSFSKGVGLAGTLGGLGQTTLYIALSLAPTVIVVPAYNLKVIVTILLSPIFIKRIEVIDAKVIVGAIMTILGVILVNLNL
jgi:drug/metabolite transporter (DMT)-like permease